MEKQSTRNSVQLNISKNSKADSMWPLARENIKEYDMVDHIIKITKKIKEPDEINPDTREIENYLLYKRKVTKKRIFMEMMGYQPKANENNFHPIWLNTDTATPRISVTDFMGGKRYNFLKQSGFLPMYDERVRTEEIKKMKDGKNILSHSNIHHIDLMRENNVKFTHTKKAPSVLPVIKTNRDGLRKTKSHKIEEIEYILNNCEILNRKNPEIEKIEKELEINATLSSNVSKIHFARNSTQKISRKELNSIKRTLDKAE